LPHTIRTPDHAPDTESGGGRGEPGSRAESRELLGDPGPVRIEKVHDRLTDRDRDILDRSPFCPQAAQSLNRSGLWKPVSWRSS
jgi:hypothetical protein